MKGVVAASSWFNRSSACAYTVLKRSKLVRVVYLMLLNFDNVSA